MSCVPLRLTAIAASAEMPVFVWIAGKERAVPQNFVHIKPDLAAISVTSSAFVIQMSSNPTALVSGATVEAPLELCAS